jgi:catechol 2,3-dioxygenase-like lactoylglutathione lyase family enzyme
MPVSGFDHAAMPTADCERFIAFYKKLGFIINDEERWRKGQASIFSLQVGPNNKINIHPPDKKGHLRGKGAAFGCGDFCFVWDGTVEEVLAMLKRAGVTPADGPVKRVGGRGIEGTSVYIHDPDGNLIEFMVYPR